MSQDERDRLFGAADHPDAPFVFDDRVARVFSDMVRGADGLEERLLVDLHHGFKPAMGYSRLEIARKRAALERVLVPDTVAVHEQRPREAGFSHQLRWFQCLHFAAWLAWA